MKAWKPLLLISYLFTLSTFSLNFKRNADIGRKIKNILVKARNIAISTSVLVGSTVVPTQGRIKEANAQEEISQSQSQLFRSRGQSASSTNAKSNVFFGSFVRDAVKTVGPSVVRIDCEREVMSLMSILAPDSVKEGESIVKVSGSGVVVTADGYILTNAHVVSQARKITVTLSNGRTFKASVVAMDELTDLAALKAEVDKTTTLVSAPIGDSCSLQSGDWLIAVGCPVGLDFTVTLGIVSSPRRSAAEVGAPHMKGSYIQTDAALNSGNSGGPLVDAAGRVIGINTMVRLNTEAIGFAIPINRAMEIFAVLKEGRKPTHAFFGLEVGSLTPDAAKIHNDDPNAQRLPEVRGALVQRVAPNSPAATTLRKFDVIVDVNGQAVDSAEEAELLLDLCRPGQIARLKVVRGEHSGRMEVFVTPRDLWPMLEERRMRRQQVLEGLRPPAQSQRREEEQEDRGHGRRRAAYQQQQQQHWEEAEK